MNDTPDICKNCIRNGYIDYYDKKTKQIIKLQLCKYKNKMEEIIKIADGDASLKTHCNFKEEK